MVVRGTFPRNIQSVKFHPGQIAPTDEILSQRIFEGQRSDDQGLRLIGTQLAGIQLAGIQLEVNLTDGNWNHIVQSYRVIKSITVYDWMVWSKFRSVKFPFRWIPASWIPSQLNSFLSDNRVDEFLSAKLSSYQRAVIQSLPVGSRMEVEGNTILVSIFAHTNVIRC